MNSIAQVEIEQRRRPQRAFIGILQRASLVSALTLFTALPLHGYAWYSGASVGSDGTVYGWGVTDVTSSTMWHVAYVSTTLTSPVKKRQAASGWLSAHNSVRADVSLGFDPSDLGIYMVQTQNEGYCYACGCWFLNCYTEAEALLRMTQYAALTYDSTNTKKAICGYALRERTYTGVDSYGYIDSTEYWVLNETLTAKAPSCGNIAIGGPNGPDQAGFQDELQIGCANTTSCSFETDQTFSVAPNDTVHLTQVPGVECLNLSGPQCYTLATTGGGAHTGWHTKVTATSVTVTNNK